LEEMDISSIRYHDQTSYDRFRMSGHMLDWSDQPRPFKEYPGVEPVPLPEKVSLPGEFLSSILKEVGAGEEDFEALTLEQLSRVLLLSYSLTAKVRHGDGDFHFRSAASAGALYPTEVYLASKGTGGLEDGLYHFSILRHALNPLRRGRLCALVREMIPGEGAGDPAAVFFFTAVFYRSAWKYRDRAYRYHLLDTGHVLENLLLALKALNIPCMLHYDFDDRRVNRLLGVDERKEVALALACIPAKSTAAGDTDSADLLPLPEHLVRASRVAKREADYPLIRAMHESGIGGKGGGKPPHPLHQGPEPSPGHWWEVPSSAPWPEKISYSEVVFLRRSRRNFLKKPLEENEIMALLDSLCIPDPKAWPPEITGRGSLEIGFLLAEGGPFPSGFYLLDPVRRAFGMVIPGGLTDRMSRICLDQAWLGNAGIHFLFLADLEELDRRWGARGYRYAMMAAGRLGQRLYLAATALGLGCCGIGAFYDGEAFELLGLKGGVRLLYLVAVGRIKGGPGTGSL